MGLCQGKGLLMLCSFWGDFFALKNSEQQIRIYIYWSGNSFWLGAKGSYSFCLEAEGCPRIFDRWGYVSF